MGAGFLLVGVGEAQLISTVTGNGTGSYLGDGSAAMAAQLNTPKGVWVDSTVLFLSPIPEIMSTAAGVASISGTVG